MKVCYGTNNKIINAELRNGKKNSEDTSNDVDSHDRSKVWQNAVASVGYNFK